MIPAFTLATVNSSGPPRTPPSLPFPLKNGKGPVDAPATVQRTFELGFDPAINGLTINGKVFDPDRIDTTVTGGDTEQWTVTNAIDIAHPFHIHITDFQVLSINGVAQPFEGQMDTVMVPATGSVVFKITFDQRFPGKFVYHCHILDHEDKGMMGVIEVISPNAPSTTTPGTSLAKP